MHSTCLGHRDLVVVGVLVKQPQNFVFWPTAHASVESSGTLRRDRVKACTAMSISHVLLLHTLGMAPWNMAYHERAEVAIGVPLTVPFVKIV